MVLVVPTVALAGLAALFVLGATVVPARAGTVSAGLLCVRRARATTSQNTSRRKAMTKAMTTTAMTSSGVPIAPPPRFRASLAACTSRLGRKSLLRGASCRQIGWPRYPFQRLAPSANIFSSRRLLLGSRVTTAPVWAIRSSGWCRQDVLGTKAPGTRQVDHRNGARRCAGASLPAGQIV